MTKWSLGYDIIRFFFRSFFKLFYRQVQSSGNENIPKNAPIIFAANHQNALIDPLAIIFTNPNQSVFLTRADIFNKPILLKIFTYFKMLPVYRIRDGAESLKNNEIIFDKSVAILEAKMSVALFPEARHTDKRHLEPLKKAVPRIAFQAEEKNHFNLNLQIVPVGIYYENYEQSNSLLFVNYGKPIELQQFKAQFEENTQHGYSALRDVLEQEIKKLIIHIQDLNHYSLYEKIRHFYRSRMVSKLQLKGNDIRTLFHADQQSVNRLQDYSQSHPQIIEALESDFSEYEKITTKLKLKFLNYGTIKLSKTIAQTLILILGSPIFIFAFLNLYLYYYLVMKMINKVKDHQFHSSFKYAISLLIAPFFYLINSLFALIWLQDFSLFVVYYFSLPLTAYWANKLRYLYIEVRNEWIFWYNSFNKKALVNDLLKKESAILQTLDQCMGLK